jgi:ribosomal-protein-alanine N-acetyltransferase
VLIIQTERFLLRPLEDTHAQALLGLYGHPDFMRFAGTGPWTTIADATRFIERAHELRENAKGMRLGIFDGPLLLGTCGLLTIDRTHRRAEMGYGVHVEHWGRGIAREAARAVLAWGFGQLALHRVVASVDPANLASIRVLEAMGFRHEGTLREHLHWAGRTFDSELHGLLAREWTGHDRRHRLPSPPVIRL